MNKDFYELHSAEYEEAMALLEELENLALMDMDWELSGGHLWD